MKHPLAQYPEFAPLIQRHGFPVRPRRRASLFQSLCRAIIAQQISGAAAASIMRRFTALYPGSRFPTPAHVLDTPRGKLQSAGLSPQKAAYITDLARALEDDTIDPRRIARMKNEDIITCLTSVQGIGVWTAQMFLIFNLGRPDVLPVGDLGIRRGFQVLYQLPALPTPAHMEKLAQPWRAHASLASWYLWRASDEAVQTRADRTAPRPHKATKRY